MSDERTSKLLIHEAEAFAKVVALNKRTPLHTVITQTFPRLTYGAWLESLAGTKETLLSSSQIARRIATTANKMLLDAAVREGYLVSGQDRKYNIWVTATDDLHALYPALSTTERTKKNSALRALVGFPVLQNSTKKKPREVRVCEGLNEPIAKKRGVVEPVKERERDTNNWTPAAKVAAQLTMMYNLSINDVVARLAPTNPVAPAPTAVEGDNTTGLLPPRPPGEKPNSVELEVLRLAQTCKNLTDEAEAFTEALGPGTLPQRDQYCTKFGDLKTPCFYAEGKTLYKCMPDLSAQWHGGAMVKRVVDGQTKKIPLSKLFADGEVALQNPLKTSECLRMNKSTVAAKVGRQIARIPQRLGIAAAQLQYAQQLQVTQGNQQALQPASMGVQHQLCNSTPQLHQPPTIIPVGGSADATNTLSGGPNQPLTMTNQPPPNAFALPSMPVSLAMQLGCSPSFSTV
eukprot:TRINITY_DN54187_c0_g1_i2.p1 TRINITY_DN54187_c0_g1~~TRINITY_DN54187_c0_g1_i2.p1  ORF type:complete len:460 (+),score=33.17 TRINITY_DN54187_c0_g1_i2:26-1405(+)